MAGCEGEGSRAPAGGTPFEAKPTAVHFGRSLRVHWRGKSGSLSSFCYLSKGAFALVYRALLLFNNGTQVAVAVKVLKPENHRSEQHRRRFFQEASVHNSLHHKHIVECLGSCTIPLHVLAPVTPGELVSPAWGLDANHECWAVVMELLGEGNLYDKVLLGGGMGSHVGMPTYPLSQALVWLIQLSSAMRYMHTLTPMLIHRDLKLENVLLTRDPADGRLVIKLCDFGLVAGIDSRGQKVEMPLSSDAYLNVGGGLDLPEEAVPEATVAGAERCSLNKDCAKLVDVGSSRSSAQQAASTNASSIGSLSNSKPSFSKQKSEYEERPEDTNDIPSGMYLRRSSSWSCTEGHNATELGDDQSHGAWSRGAAGTDLEHEGALDGCHHPGEEVSIHVATACTSRRPPLQKLPEEDSTWEVGSSTLGPEASGTLGQPAQANQIMSSNTGAEASSNTGAEASSNTGARESSSTELLKHDEGTKGNSCSDETLSRHRGGASAGKLLRSTSFTQQYKQSPGLLNKLKAMLSHKATSAHVHHVYRLTARCGSILYMAPEVARDKAYNEKADVFSFGVITYEMLSRSLIATSIPPNDVDAAMDHMLKVAWRGWRPVLPTYLPEQLKQLLTLCWHAESRKRPSFAEIQNQLEDAQRSGLGIALDSAERSCVQLARPIGAPSFQPPPAWQRASSSQLPQHLPAAYPAAFPATAPQPGVGGGGGMGGVDVAPPGVPMGLHTGPSNRSSDVGSSGASSLTDSAACKGSTVPTLGSGLLLAAASKLNAARSGPHVPASASPSAGAYMAVPGAPLPSLMPPRRSPNTGPVGAFKLPPSLAAPLYLHMQAPPLRQGMIRGHGSSGALGGAHPEPLPSGAPPLAGRYSANVQCSEEASSVAPPRLPSPATSASTRGEEVQGGAEDNERAKKLAQLQKLQALAEKLAAGADDAVLAQIAAATGASNYSRKAAE